MKKQETSIYTMVCTQCKKEFLYGAPHYKFQINDSVVSHLCKCVMATCIITAEREGVLVEITQTRNESRYGND